MNFLSRKDLENHATTWIEAWNRHDVDAVITCDENAQTVLVHYVSHAGGKTLRACELMRFENGLQVYGEAFYGADVSEPSQ